jgi:hypothetical protein
VVQALADVRCRQPRNTMQGRARQQRRRAVACGGWARALACHVSSTAWPLQAAAKHRQRPRWQPGRYAAHLSPTPTRSGCQRGLATTGTYCTAAAARCVWRKCCQA